MTSESNTDTNTSNSHSTTWDPSLWNSTTKPRNPKHCPHCNQEIAHPSALGDNTDIAASTRFEAYRQHRKTHFNWGTDPETKSPDGDPFLDAYYDSLEVEDTDQPVDPDEEVAGVYDVTVQYEAKMDARVVASDKHQAKQKAKRLRGEQKDLHGDVPTTRLTHELHSTTREVRQLTRGEIHDSDTDTETEGTKTDTEDSSDSINYADRLPGWPW